MKPDDRRNALHVCEANLLWLLLDGRMARAEQLLCDSELQAAVIRAQNPAGGPPPGDGNGSHSDPTADAALSGAATELRATEIRRCWHGELREITGTVAWLRATISAEPEGPRDLASTLRSLRWLTEVPHDRARLVHLTHDGEALAEIDHAIAWVHDRSTALRSGTLHTAANKRAPSVHAVLESARKVSEAAPPPPKQKPLEGCVSCKRDAGYFEAIDMKNHSKRSMCRTCGDYASGEGSWLPLGAVQYMHRTGKNLTWKIIEQAKQTEKAS